MQHNIIFYNMKGKKHGQCHVRSNTDFNNHNTAGNETLSHKNKAPSSYELVQNKNPIMD